MVTREEKQARKRAAESEKYFRRRDGIGPGSYNQFEEGIRQRQAQEQQRIEQAAREEARRAAREERNRAFIESGGWRGAAGRGLQTAHNYTTRPLYHRVIRPAAGVVWNEGLRPAGNRFRSGAGMMTDVAATRVAGAVGVGWTNLFIFLSIILYASDLGTRFNGINVAVFLKNFTDIFSWQWLANGVVLVILISYALINRPSPREAISFIVLVELFSLIFFLGGFTYGVFHIIFAILIYIFLVRPTATDAAAANYTLAILLAFDFFGYGLLDKYLPGVLANRLIVPIWFYYSLLLTNQTQKSFFTKTVIILVVLFNVAVVAYGINETYSLGMSLTNPDYKEAADFGKTGIAGVKELATGLWAALKGGYVQRMEYATGGYYESEVEQNEKEPLGVYLENIEPADSEYFEDEQVIIWATVKARTLDKPVQIQVNCSAADAKGKVTPEDKFEIYSTEEEDISCKFNGLGSGSNTITLSTEFNFETMAYLKSYFMHQEKLRALTRQNIDVFDEYGITDKEPISKCTNGPVNLGIGTKTPPIGVYKEGEGTNTMPKLGITLANSWDGEIKEIKRLLIQIPDSLSIEPGSCDHEFVESNLIESGFNVYELKDPGDKKLRNITDSVTFNCRLQVTDPTRLLGDTPLSVKYFRATAEYTYIAKKTITLDIKESGSTESSYMGTDSEARPKQECYGQTEDSCRQKELCFASYEKGAFKECKECAADSRACTLINKENFCPDDPKKCEEYCSKDPCYHYCKWMATPQGIGSCVNMDTTDIRKELVWPLAKEDNIITKCYENKKEDKYYGIAISAKEGDQVKAAGKGIIVINTDDLATNHAIEIWHYPGFKTRYQNLNIKEEDITNLKWNTVKKGDAIGTVGNYKTKDTDEIYLYFATLENNVKVNPLIGGIETRGYYKPEAEELNLKFKSGSNCCESGNEMYTTCEAPGRKV